MGALLKYVSRIRGVESKYQVKSHTNPNKYYIVEVLKGGEMNCDCIAGGFGKPCRHQKLVKKFLKK